MKSNNDRTITTWLKTDLPVVPTNQSMRADVSSVEAALQAGVLATVDEKRPGFYEIEIRNRWYYIHIPDRIQSAYIVASGEPALAPCSTG